MFAGRRWTARRSCRATAPRRATTPRRPYSCRTSRPNKPCRRHTSRNRAHCGGAAPHGTAGVCATYIRPFLLVDIMADGSAAALQAAAKKKVEPLPVRALSGMKLRAKSHEFQGSLSPNFNSLARKCISTDQKLLKGRSSSIDLEAALCPAFATCLHPARACGVSLLPPTPRITWKSCRQTTGVFTSSSARRVFGEAFVATPQPLTQHSPAHPHHTADTALHSATRHDTSAQPAASRPASKQ